MFLPQSGLYNERVARRAAEYYNMSSNRPSGVPPGFFPTGNSSLFHVYLDANLNQE